ncbi:MAG: hypothetical protein V4447_14250 [Pseudomonadota bacterium]
MATFFRCLFCFVLLGCGYAQLDVMTSVYAAEPSAGKSQSLTLKLGQPATATQFGLSIQLIEFKDSRCPEGARCIWAGHATATLLLTRGDAITETIIVGTEAPVAMQLPYQVTSWDLKFSLTALEPAPSTKGVVPAESVRATVLIEKR